MSSVTLGSRKASKHAGLNPAKHHHIKAHSVVARSTNVCSVSCPRDRGCAKCALIW